MAVAAGLTARSQGLALESLLQHNPFGASAGTAPAQTSAGPALELHGILTEGREQFFSLSDPAGKTSAWVRLGETGQSFVVKRYDAPQESVTVAYQGREVTVRLKDAGSGRAGDLAASAVAGARRAPPVIPASFVKAEAQRLSAVLAEIRRRRALREPVEKR